MKTLCRGKVDIAIPVGGTVADALLFVPDEDGKVDLFNALTGVWEGSIRGNGKGSKPGQFSNHIWDICIATTGPQNQSELFVADFSNGRVSVFDPWTGAYIRQVGQTMGSDTGDLFCPTGLLVQLPSAPGGNYLLYVTEIGNNRVQVFDAVTGSHLRCIGAGEGTGPGQLKCPYGGAVLCPAPGNEGEERGGNHELFVSL